MRHELSLNATSFIQQFALNSSSQGITSPYLFQYKLLGNKLNGLRAGIGGSYSEEQEFGSIDNFPPNPGSTFRSYRYNAEVRLGYERSTTLSNRWDVFYGFDGLFGYRPSVAEATSDVGLGEDLVTTNEFITTTFGGGPVLGIRFRISERIYLFTESSAYFTRSETKERTSYSNPDFGSDSEETSRQLDLQMLLPTNIFFAIRF